MTSAESGRAAGATLALAVAGTAVAALAQSIIPRSGWGSVACFASAAVLFGWSARRAGDAAELDAAATAPLPRRFLQLCVAGVALCLAASVLVYAQQPASATHLVWTLGLLVLALAAFAAPRGERRLAPMSVRQRVGLAAVLGFAGVVLFCGLPGLPTEMHGDDAEVGLDAIRLLANFNLFDAGWFELPRFHAFPTLLGFEVLGINALGLRATSAALGVAGVALLFAVVRRLWSVELGLLAALLLAGQRFYLHIGRAGYHYIDTPVLSLLVVWLFLQIWQERRLGAAVWCGLGLGLGIQTYYASRLVPLLLILTWCSALWPLVVALRRAPGGGAARLRLAAREQVPGFAVVVLIAIAVAAPTFAYFAHHWGAFWERTRDTSLFTPAARQHLAVGYQTDSFIQILAIQLRAALTLFNATRDTSVQYGLRGAFFEPVSAVLFVLGVGAACARLRERRMRLVLLWTAVPLIAGAALTIDTPFYPRISGLVPFAVLLVCVALDQLRRAVRAAVPGRIGAWTSAALIGAAATLIVATNARTYFIDYAPRYRVAPSVEIANFVRKHGADKTTYMVGGLPAYSILHGTIAFLTYGYATHDIERLDAFLSTHQLDPLKTAFVIMPQGVDLIPQVERAVGRLDLQTHRNARGEVAFLSAVPAAAHDALDSADELKQSAQPGPTLAAVGRGLALLEQAARTVLIGTAALALGLALLAARGWRRGPGVRALREPWRPRLARWRRAWFGPDGHEQRALPPSWMVWAALLAIVALAFALRTYRLTELPAGFFCDEAGNGFNSFCLLHAGRDETGARWPLYIWSFDVSYKNPIFVYSTLLPMSLLGASELAVRLTAALYGTATVLALFFLGRALMGPLTGLAAALLLATLPWHLHFSRIGFELITLPFFFTLGLTCMVRWTQGRRTLAPALVLLGLCLYTYVPAKLFIPLFLAVFAVLYRRELLARWRETLLAAAALALTALPVTIFDIAHHSQAGSYFANTTILARGAQPLGVARRFVKNYRAFFSRTFLFDASNDRILRHSVSDHGELYWCLAPLLGVGVVVAALRRDRAMRLPLVWLGLYPAAAALMNEIPSASRGFIGAPAFALLGAIGAGGLLRLAARVGPRRAGALQGLLIAVGVAVLGTATARYWALYRDEYPLYAAKEYTGFQFGHRQVLDYFRQHYDEYDLLLLSTRRSNQPEVFLRFYDGTQRPLREGEPPPFEHGEKMVASAADAYDYYLPGRRILFAVLPEEVPLFADGKVLERIIAPDGSAAFVLVAATRLKDFVSTWMVGGPYPGDDHSPPPDWNPDAPPPDAGDGVSWRLQNQLFADVLLNDFFSPNAEHTCAWAENFVSSETPRTLRVFAGFDDTGEVFVNGAAVALTPSDNPEQTLIDASSGTLELAAGRNRIAVRSCDDIGDWRFSFRLENLDGSPVEGLTWAYGPRRYPE